MPVLSIDETHSNSGKLEFYLYLNFIDLFNIYIYHLLGHIALKNIVDESKKDTEIFLNFTFEEESYLDTLRDSLAASRK
jgi:hypothetical protein